ncbi:EF-hand calcium-binding domain-containing protein 12 [Ascaphus truei]|uniref:EF-hand calcium-binding domain-containing protein 12 n=1 Tax=Ascaphus truei TaxID=8439 RepID=UPI003F5A7B8E
MPKAVSFQETPQELSVDDDLKRYRQRDLFQTLFFKAACRSFGAPKSRRRRIIAPPMEKVETAASCTEGALHGARSGRSKSDGDAEKPVIPEGDPRQGCAEWISDRKKLRAHLDSMVDLKKWLVGKLELTETEYRVLDRMSETPTQTQTQTPHVTTRDTDAERPRTPQCCWTIPSIQQPCPEALAILDYYLRKHQLRLVDLYNQIDKHKRWNISIRDLRAARKEARIPISDAQFDDLVSGLSSKIPNVISYKELSVGRQSWRMETKEQRRRDLTVKSVGRSLAPEVRVSDCDRVQATRSGSSSLNSEESLGSRSAFLQVPRISLEEGRPLNYDDMEEIGRMYRERRRRVKSDTLEWFGQSRPLRSGNAAVDAHSMPSTLGGEAGVAVDQFRRQCLQQYYEVLKLCKSHGVPLCERLLERGLLYPGDSRVSSSGQRLRIRQPGTALTCAEAPAKRQPSVRKDSQDSLRLGLGLDLHKEPASPRESSRVTYPASTVPYPTSTYVRRVKAKVRGRSKAGSGTTNCWTTFEQFQEMSRNLKRKFPHAFLTADDNAFWPGHLLDNLRIYLPQVAQRARSVVPSLISDTRRYCHSEGQCLRLLLVQRNAGSSRSYGFAAEMLSFIFDGAII